MIRPLKILNLWYILFAYADLNLALSFKAVNNKTLEIRIRRQRAIT